MSKRKKTGECVYCGTIGLVTKDHIPPKNLFKRPRPHNLITVPSCLECNSGSSKDDDYFQYWAVSREDGKGNCDRDGILPSITRSLERPEAAPFSHSFLREIKLARKVSPGGLDLGVGLFMAADGKRLDNVAKRIIKGLFFHITKHRLPDDHCVQVVHHSRWKLLPHESRVAGNDFVIALLDENPVKIGEAFRFWHLLSPNGWARSVWLIELYGQLEYFCTTCPVELLNTASAGATIRDEIFSITPNDRCRRGFDQLVDSERAHKPHGSVGEVGVMGGVGGRRGAWR